MDKLISFLKINRALGVSYLILIFALWLLNWNIDYLYIIAPLLVIHSFMFAMFVIKMYKMQQEFRFSSTKLAGFVFLSFLPLGSLMIDYDIKEEFFIKKPIWINLL